MKKKKRIIIFSHYVKNSDNKYLTYTHNHAKTYIRLGYDVTVFAPYAVLPIVSIFKKNKKVKIDGVDIELIKRFSLSKFFATSPINIHGLFYYFAVKEKVKKLIEDDNIIYFDAHNFRSEGYTAYLLKKKYPSIKATITLHGGDMDQALSNKHGIKRLQKISKTIDTYICVSDNYKKKLEEIDINNVVTIYNGIVMHNVKKVKKEETFITVANLIERKNIGLLIDAFNEFSKSNKDYKLKIIGDGILKKELEKKVSEYKLKDKIEFLGQINNEKVYNEFCKAYCFILVSVLEAFGIVYPESMYCGCIAIGTKNEGIDGFIKNGENGFLVNPDLEEVVKIMNYVVNNDCSKVIENGTELAKKLTWENNCNNYLKIIGEKDEH